MTLANLVWQNGTNWPWVALVLFVALGWQARGYLRSPMRGWPRFGAFGLKSLAWALIALCALDPVWTRTQAQKGANEVAMLIDTSASMALPSAKGTLSRTEAAGRMIGSATARPGWWSQVEESFRVRLLGAGERLRALSGIEVADHQESRSRLTTSLTTLSATRDSANLAAIVLFTDGCATDADPQAISDDIKVPVFPVMLGSTSEGTDLAIQDVNVTQTPFEDSPVVIQASVRALGFKGREIELALADGDRNVVARTQRQPESDDVELSIRLEAPGVAPGVQFRQLWIAESQHLDALLKSSEKVDHGEVTIANNVRRLCIDRGRGPYRILYVAGRPNWEYKFLRRSLHADPEIQMPALIRIAKREPKFEWRGRTGETTNPLFRGFGAEDGDAQRYDQPVLVRLETRDAEELADGFPKTAEELFGGYRAIIIDDLEASFFTVEQMRLIEDFVARRGGALLMLGGQESFQAGGYEHTPIGQLLPAHVDSRRRPRRIDAGRFDLTREGWLEPWARLHPERGADESRIAGMPAFHATNRVEALKPGASLLATIRDPETGFHPAILAQRFGSGRVAAVAVADLWRWGMVGETARADLEQAWRQLIRWLVVDVEDRVTVDVTPGDKALPSASRMHIRVRDEGFKPSDDALAKVEVSRIDDDASEPLKMFAEPSLEEPGLFSAEHFAGMPGDYRAEVTVEADGEILSEKQTGWTFDPLPDELRQVRPNVDLLSRLAIATGGQLLMPADVDRLPSLLADLDVPVEETVSTPVWHSPWVFAMVIGCLGGEWYLRRRFGWV